MNEFEIRYNSMEHAKLIMIQRLVYEIALLKGEDAERWTDAFRNAVITEINDTKTSDGQRPREITNTSVSIVEGVANMVKGRLQQRSE